MIFTAAQARELVKNFTEEERINKIISRISERIKEAASLGLEKIKIEFRYRHSVREKIVSILEEAGYTTESEYKSLVISWKE